MDYSAVPADDVQAAYDGRYLRPQAEDEQEDIAYHGGGESSLMGKAELSFDSDEDKDKITGKILSSLIALALTYVGEYGTTEMLCLDTKHPSQEARLPNSSWALPALSLLRISISAPMTFLGLALRLTWDMS